MRDLSRSRALRVVAAHELLIRLKPAVGPELAHSAAYGLDVTDAWRVPTLSWLRRLVARVGGVRLAGLAAVAGVLGLEIWAIRVNYGLRVTSDTPTFLALLREMSLHPLRSVSPFVPGAALQTSHATPYMQALAWIWNHAVASHDASGQPLTDPVAAYRFLALVGVVVTAALLHACFLWVRRCAGTRAGWISIPVVLLLFGPAHVIWAGDLTFQGFLYAS